MLTHAKKLTQSKFVRNVAIVATGTAGAQAITMAFSPIITRLYGPEAFGLLGTFMAILAIATPIAALTYPIAIVLPKSDRDALGLAKLSAGLALGMAGFLAFLLLLFGDWLAELLSLQSIASFMLLIPVAMLFAAFHQILQQWLIRKKQFKITARVAVLQALTLNSAKAGIGWFHPLGAVLIILATLGHALHTMLLWLGIRNQPAAQSIGEPDTTSCSLKELAVHHKGFPYFRAPQAFINAVSHSLPVLMLASFFGPAAAGFYTLSKSVMGVPLTLISKSVGDVFYPRITEASHNNENLYQLILRATLSLAAIGFLPFLFVVVMGPWLFSLVFGEAWVIAGEYSRWMALWLFFGFINRPSVVAIPVLGLLDFFLFFEVVSVLLRTFAIYIGVVVFNSDMISVALFSLFGLCLNFALILYALTKSRKSRC